MSDETATLPRRGNSSKGNLTQYALDAIRQDILDCKLAPDRRLTVEDLRGRYQVGATPLREALMRLTTDGLVAFEQNRGFRVAPISREDFDDAVEAYVGLSLLGLSKSIRLGDDEWEGAIVSSFHRLAKLTKLWTEHDKPEMNPQWFKVHQLFHRNLVGACESRWLLTFYDTIADHNSRYLRVAVVHLELPRDDETEHRNIMTAVLARDTEKACTLLREHILRTRDKLVSIKPSIFG